MLFVAFFMYLFFTLSLSLEKITQILEKSGISSSQEEEILTTTKNVITPPETNKELMLEESCISNEEHLFKQEIKEDEEGISGDQNQEVNHAYGSFIEQWFQATIRVDQFGFCFYFVKLHFQQ